MPRPSAPALVSLVVTFAIWIGLFFGLLYPEIRRADFTLAKCTVLSSDVAPRYSCGKSCSACTPAPYAAPSCDGLVATFQGFNPRACLNGTREQCPVQGETCGDGYRCCATVCQQCCSTSCGGKPVSCRTTCVPCMCVCVSSVSNDQCSVTCSTLYTAVIRVQYPVSQEGNRTLAQTYVTQDYGTDQAGAQAFVAQHAGYFPCYYDSGNPFNGVVLSRDYDAWVWAVFMVVGCVPFLAALIVCTAELLDAWAAISIWLGVIVPLFVFLPVAYAGAVSPDARMGLTATACVSIAIFNIPVVKERGGPVLLLEYIGLVFWPIGIATPIYLYASEVAGIVLYVLSIAAGVVFCLGGAQAFETSRATAAPPRPLPPPSPVPLAPPAQYWTGTFQLEEEGPPVEGEPPVEKGGAVTLV